MKKTKFAGEELALGAAVVAALWALVGAGASTVMWGFDVNQTGFIFIVLWLVIFIALSLGWREATPPTGGKKAPTAADHDLSASAPTAPAAAEAPAAPSATAQAPSSGTAPAAAAAASSAPAPEPAAEDPGEGTRPEALDGPRDGTADDLKQIKGVGPALEKLCNSLGFYHFDQIANWSAAEVAWVDQNLEGFKGRVTRDNWVEQAKVLASGGSTEFADRVEKGDVY